MKLILATALLFISIIASGKEFCPMELNKESFSSDEYAKCVRQLTIRGYRGLSESEKRFIADSLQENVFYYFGMEAKYNNVDFAKVALTFNYQENFNSLMRGVQTGSEETLDLNVYLFQRDPDLFLSYAGSRLSYVENLAWSFKNVSFYELTCENARILPAAHNYHILEADYKFSDEISILRSELELLLECPDHSLAK